MPNLNEMQLDARSRGLGGSDVPVVLGAVNYKTPVQLWLEKRGKTEPLDISENFNIKMGHRLEPVVVDCFEDELSQHLGQKVKVRQVNKPRVDKEFEFMVANVDGIVEGMDAGFEAKAFSPFARDDWGESGSGDVPLAVTAQCAHYMRVFNRSRWYVGVLLGIHDFRWYLLERDESVINSLIEIENAFWKDVTNSTHPRVLESADLVKLYPHGDDELVYADEATLQKARRLVQLRTEAKENEAEQNEIKLDIQKVMTGHANLMVEGHANPIITWHHSKDRHNTKWKEVAAELVQRYEIDDEDLTDVLEMHTTTVSPGPRSFLVKDKRIGEL